MRPTSVRPTLSRMGEEKWPADLAMATAASVSIVLLGMGLQQLLQPSQAAWGFYELVSFALVAIVWLVCWVGRLVVWLRDDA